MAPPAAAVLFPQTHLLTSTDQSAFSVFKAPTWFGTSNSSFRLPAASPGRRERPEPLQRFVTTKPG